MAKAQEFVYAVIGAGDVAVDKVKGVRKFADRKRNEKLYNDFIKRGRTISTKVKNSKPGKQVRAQTEELREQAGDAFKSVTKAFGVNVVSWPKGRGTGAQKSGGTRKSTARKSPARKSTTRKSTASKAS
jgi:hypothetical protein